MNDSIKVAIVQMCSGYEVSENLEQAENLLTRLKLKRAMTGSADLILLPECFAKLGGGMSELASNITLVRQWMAETAKQKNAWLIGGSIPFSIENDENCRASCFVYNPKGQEVDRYDKIHLFDADVQDNTGRYRESDDYSAGNKPVVVDMGFARVGLSICYDLRFPELYRILTAQGAGILTVPSAFSHTTGEAHWQTLLRARAIENQCYVLAANQAGWHPNKRQTWGHSMVISPWGDVMAEAEQEPCVIEAELDLTSIADVRSRMPCQEHRKV